MGASLGTLTLDLIAKTGGFTGPLDKATRLSKKNSQSIGKHNKAIRESFNKTLSTIKTYAAGYLSIMAATKVVAGSIRIGAAFEQEMKTVQGVMRATDEEFMKLSDAAKEMGATTQWTATQSAQALEYMGMAGWSVQKSIESLPNVLKLATAGGLDLARASDIVTDSLTAMGMGAEDLARFNDVLIGTITRSNTNIEMLGESLKYVAPIASQFGYSIENTSAMLGILANAGIKASDAGTDLRKAMVQNIKVSKQLRTAQDDLIGTLKAAREAGWGVNEIVKGYGLLASKSVLVLMDQIDAYEELNEKLHNVNGETDALAKKKLDTLIGDFKILKSAVEGVGLNIFKYIETPLRKSVQLSTKLISGLSIEASIIGGKSIDFIKTERGISDALSKGGKEGINDLITQIEYLKSKWKEQNEITEKWKNKLDQINKGTGNANVSAFVKILEKERHELNALEEQIGITQIALNKLTTSPDPEGIIPTSLIPKPSGVSGPTKEEMKNLESWYDHWQEYDFEATKNIYENKQKLLDDQMSVIDDSLEYLKWAADEEMKIDQEIADNKKMLLLEEMEMRRQSVATAAYAFDRMASLAKEYGNDQTDLYKSLFAASKAFSIAESVLNMWQAISEAGTLPFPANLAAMAIVGAEMANIISNIMAVGMAHSGIDSVPETGTWLLKKGERVVTAETSQRLDNTLSRIQNDYSRSSSMTDNRRMSSMESKYTQNYYGPVFLTRSQMKDAARMFINETEREKTRRGAIG